LNPIKKLKYLLFGIAQETVVDKRHCNFGIFEAYCDAMALKGGVTYEDKSK
jgi:hypothetical protein